MSAQSDCFMFCDGLSHFSEGDDLIARVPAAVTNRDQLFDVLSRELSLPSYFGRNWDALSECLRDLSWINRRRVIIAHETVPNLEAATLRGYLGVLAECTSDWKPDEEHELLVVFPERAEAEIRGIVKQDKGTSRILTDQGRRGSMP